MINRRIFTLILLATAVAIPLLLHQPTRPAAAQSTNAVIAEGQVTPLAYVNLAFQTGGQVADILIQEGSVVSIGDPLIQLDSDAQELALAQAEAGVVSAETAVTAAQNQLTLAQTSINSAQTAVTIAEANLALVQAGARPEEIAAAEAQLAAAEATLAQASASRDVALDTISDADIASAAAQLAQATAELRALEEAYQEILDACFTTPDDQEICPLYGPVEEQTREQLEIARLNEAAARELVAFLNNGPTTGQQAAANGAVALAAANRNLAQAQLDALLAGATPEEIEQAAVRVAQAELGVMAAETAVAQAEATVAQAEAGLQAAQAARDAAQVAVQRTTLRATMAGTVAQLDLNLGELVTPGTPVLTLADFSGWQVETTDLSELDVPQVQEGSTVQVTFEALPDADVRGVVQQIALIANRAPGDVVYEVTIQLSDTADLPLRWGMTAGVAFGQ